MGSHTDRVVVLVDMDCFYCQVEEKLDSSLVGKPIAVVQYNAWKGGGLIAVNYLARDKGVTRHMRGDEAREKCPDIVLVKVPTVRGKADLTKYREGGKRVAEVLQTFTPLLQRASVDEAYLDITEAVANRLQAMDRKATIQDLQSTYVVGCETTDFIDCIYNSDMSNEHNLKLLIGGVIVEEIRAAVYEKTGYRCSAGIAHNKILAKLSCGMNKPNKQTLLPHDSVEEMYKTLPIRKIKSLGGKFGNSLAEDLNIKYMSEMVQFSEKELMKKYDDKTAIWLYNIARGIDLEPVETRLISKSIGCCKRFPGKTALITTEDVMHWLSELAEELSERLEQDLQENNRKAKNVVLSFAQEINKKDVHSSRTMVLNSYEAKKITEDTFETLKKFTQKPDGSFVIKFLGLSAGKFDIIKNVNDISSFFKQFNKKDTTVNSNNNKNTEETNKPEIDNEISEITEKNCNMNYLSKNSNCTQNLNTFSNSFSSKKSKSKANIMNFLTVDKKNNIATEDKKIEITKNLISTNLIEANNNSEEEINLSDIENDVETSLDTSIAQNELNHSIINDGCFSDSTVENDFTEILNNKSEFPHKTQEYVSEKSNELIVPEKKSPIFGNEQMGFGNSFFLRYIKKREAMNNNAKQINNFEQACSSKYSENQDETSDSNDSVNKNETKCNISKNDLNYVEPVAGSSKSYETHLEICNSDSNDSLNKLDNDRLPVEAIYYNNCDDSPNLVENKENLEICPECNENFPKNMFMTHMDHHMALKLMEEERKIFKNEFELEKQRRLNKSPTIKEIMKSKTAKTSKQIKRKLNQPENNTNITSFFQQKVESSDKTEICLECGKNIETSEYTSHLDFHTAKKLHLELNPVKIVSKNNFKNNKKNVKNVSTNNNSVTNFFKPK